MTNNIVPTYEITLDSEYVDDVAFTPHEQDRLILQQFKGDNECLYLLLNGQQVKVELDSIKRVIDMFYEVKGGELRNE